MATASRPRVAATVDRRNVVASGLFPGVRVGGVGWGAQLIKGQPVADYRDRDGTDWMSELAMDWLLPSSGISSSPAR